jgi:predicted MFS family arabinose efflux permease
MTVECLPRPARLAQNYRGRKPQLPFRKMMRNCHTTGAWYVSTISTTCLPNNQSANQTTQAKKTFVVFVSILCVMNSTISSGLASNSAPYFAREFGISSKALLVLPTATFLLGYTVGPQAFGPLSEQYGRKKVMIWAFAFFAIFTMAVALSPNFAALVILRFFEGIAAACPITVVGG